jgi:serine/threonine protein kinase
VKPTTIGPYRVLDLVGQGGMGAVYEAEHQDPARRQELGVVAIKVMHPHLAASPGFGERFAREGRVGLSLDHPGISRVIEVIEQPPAIVMEHIQGRHLGSFLGAPLPPAEVVGLLRQLGDALGHAHDKGVVHRDLKPENVLLTPGGRAMLLDFGIAKVAGDGHTRTGTGMGSVVTMAPEQYRDAKRVDARADVYALAMLATWMLAGRPPWKPGLPEFELLMLKAQGDLTPLSEMVGGLPQGLDADVAAGLTPEPEDRLPSVEALLTLMEHAVSPQVGATFVFELDPTPAPRAEPEAEDKPEPGSDDKPEPGSEDPPQEPETLVPDDDPQPVLTTSASRWVWPLGLGLLLAAGLAALASVPRASSDPLLQDHGVQLATLPATRDQPALTASRSALPASMASELEVDCVDCGAWLLLDDHRSAMELCNLISDREGLVPAYFLTGSEALLDAGSGGFRLATAQELQRLASVPGAELPERTWTQEGEGASPAAVWLVRD